MTPSALDASDFTRRYLNLADPRFGAEAVSASDDFFAPKERMLNPEPAIFIPGKYDEHGKWMDGWETRRKRVPGHDWCIVRLGRTGAIKGVDLDTSHFTGNYPAAASIEACHSLDLNVSGAVAWNEILPATNLKGDSHHYLPITGDQVYSHVRLNIYPDGGSDDSLIPQSMFWPTLLAEQKLEMDRQHFFASELAELGPVSHIRFNIIPDGGVSRLRLWSELS